MIAACRPPPGVRRGIGRRTAIVSVDRPIVHDPQTVTGQMTMNRYRHGKLSGVGETSLQPCPCCGHRTGCTTCPVCFWTDDGRAHDAGGSLLTGGPNGELSLIDARLNFSVYGASHQRYRDLVRAPRSHELP